jgi:hypothetical protein
MNLFDNTIRKILSLPLFIERPPVLLDIGASGEIFEKWKLIADNSVCIAFDADDRDFNCNSDETSGYKKLFKFNRIVTPIAQSNCNFYLTNSPYCSSTLLPDRKSLKSWMFANLFEVDRTVTLESTTISACLQNIGLEYIDWYKVDSQGIDLDLFQSIPEVIREKILAADFEPGIMDAYIGENKLSDLLQYLDNEKYWISSFDVKGTQRLNEEYSSYRNLLHESPCWAGITSIKEFDCISDVRSRLLLVVFSLVENQWGYALQVCENSLNIDPQFGVIKSEILAIINKMESKRDFKGKVISKIIHGIKKVLKLYSK